MTLPAALFILLLLAPTAIAAGALKTDTLTFGFPFDQTYYNIFNVTPPAMISNEALQITPDSSGNFSLTSRAGRVLRKTPFLLWSKKASSVKLASFNTTFLVNIFRSKPNTTGEGMAFVIAPDLLTPPGSDGEYLGLTNSTTDGLASNRLFAVELDTAKQSFDPDDNHIGIDINGVKSNRTVSLSDFNITLSPSTTVFHKIWINYDGVNKSIEIFISDQSDKFAANPMPEKPVLTMSGLDLSEIVAERSYFGFSAATGETTQELHCVLSWNMTVELIGPGKSATAMIVGVVVAIVAVAVVLVLAAVVLRRRRKGRTEVVEDPNILGALKSLPGTPREFEFKDLKRATGNFDEKNRLGQGGYGVVYRGFFPEEVVQEVAVKRFTREDYIKSKDDFLCELTIINRLRHRHLVKLLGWCHKSGMLLLVYEYMPNGSLDRHIFCAEDETPIGWSVRYKILRGVASALQYLHYEYDETVIHRDLKANNIMLDAHFNARLGDFGLARAIDQEKTSYAEMGGVHGTMGYIAPECFHTGKATRQSDVYAFGAVLLEVATGHRPWTKLGGYSCLVDWVWSLHRDRQILQAIDPRLGKDYVAEEAERVLLLALACSHPTAVERPKTHALVQILCGSVAVPTVPPFKPSFVWPSMCPMGLDTSLDMSMTADSTPVGSSQFETEWTPHSYNPDSYNATPRSFNQDTV